MALWPDYGSWLPLTGIDDHTLGHTKVGRNPLDERTARRRGLYLTTHNSHNRQNIHTPVGFEPTIPASERSQTHALDRAPTHYYYQAILQTGGNRVNTDYRAQNVTLTDLRSKSRTFGASRWESELKPTGKRYLGRPTRNPNIYTDKETQQDWLQLAFKFSGWISLGQVPQQGGNIRSSWTTVTILRTGRSARLYDGCHAAGSP